MEKIVKVPGSCGELIQGYKDNSNFLISCPIDIYSTVKVKTLSKKENIEISKRKDKTKKALKKLLKYYNSDITGLKVEISSQLPESKGLGSSTADITAALLAAFLVMDREIDLRVIKDIAIEVEPTDATFLQGISLFDHIEGRFLNYLGEIEPIPLMVFDYGGEVDTLDFNMRTDLFQLNKNKADKVNEAYSLIKKGIEQKDSKLIGQGATLSSLANQNILNKPGLEHLVDLLKEQAGFLGINTAHSGTVIGIMVSDKKYFNDISQIVELEYPELNLLFKTKIINGGYKIIN